MIELPNFGYMNTSTTQFKSLHKFFLVTPWTKTMTSQTFF